MSFDLWKNCADLLEDELSSQQFNTWIRPLKVIGDEHDLCLLAPNRFVADWVREKFLPRIEELLENISDDFGSESPAVALAVSNKKPKSLIRRRKNPPEKLSESYSIRNKLTSTTLDLKNKIDAQLAKPAITESLKKDLVENEVQQDQISIDKLLISNIKTSIQPVDNTEIESINSVDNKNNNKNKNKILQQQNTPVDKLKKSNQTNQLTLQSTKQVEIEDDIKNSGSLNSQFVFNSFVEGKSNQLALAASRQIVQNPGSAYNPLFLYGGVGLGKTHLMHAVGNALVEKKSNARVIYLHSERFVADMVKALQLNAINDFKKYYRSVDALLIDDIQFFSGKERSQEEFFHTFNALLEGGQQMILTCDRYPKEIHGIAERLKSRLGWGLTVAVDPPELETRVAILMKKAEQQKIDLPTDAAFFIAKRIRSNVRELEGALKRVIANAHFMGKKITIDLIRESLKDLLALQEQQVSIENIQRTVAEYYKIKISDILSKRRSRSVARPRQIAMALSKELTGHSLPEIGEAYGGRDHTTVLHACRKVKELIASDNEINKDYKNLLRSVTN